MVSFQSEYGWTNSAKLRVFEIFDLHYTDLEARVRGHSRSSEPQPSRLDPPPIWLPINIPWQRWAYLVPFQINTAISAENRKFFHLRVICTPAEGVPFRIEYRRLGSKKLESWGYRAEKDVWRYLQPSGYNARTCWTNGHRTTAKTARYNA